MQGTEQNNDEIEKESPLVKFRENFIPYMDKDEDGSIVMKWAVYDAKSDPNHDGTTLFEKALAAEISDTPITKNRLEELAPAYYALPKFGSDHHPETAIKNLQEHLGNKDVYKYLKRYGFDEDSPLSFEIETEIKSHSFNFSINPDPKARQEKELVIEPIIKAEEKSAGSVPIGDDEYWLDNDAANLLHSALVYKHKQIQENVQNSLKEQASAVFYFSTAFMGLTTAATTQSAAVTMLSTISSLSSIASISSMGYSAYNSNKDYNKALKIWANLNNNINNPDTPRKEAHKILKKEMRESGVSFEGIPNVEYSKYRDLKPTLHKEAELKGYFAAPITKQDALKVSDRLRQYAQTTSNKTKLIASTGINALHMAAKGLSECVTDLFLWNKDTRQKIGSGIKHGFKITATDTKNSTQLKNTTKLEKTRQEHRKKALYEFNKQPDIITPELNVDDIKQHKEILDEIPRVQTGKNIAKINFLNVSTAMASQTIELGYHTINLDIPNMGKAFYGLAMGIGSYAQTGHNLHDADAVLHSKRVEEAKAHGYIDDEMIDRILQNQQEQSQSDDPPEPP